ncbi:Putative N2,N2-dimethylguanosine tRNA methyltransferase [Phaffia rhodozyma]|uniref:Protein-lysine N-methyltransferase EFM6 n=1 Tax=Phaffia rhodozyma TaxID=264483 RepID=A0A0F7SRR3_PHARH|nr:Putative N2,N2-dimethylguanosine tRNA methyltransferase [Phaffia rhodozyma]
MTEIITGSPNLSRRSSTEDFFKDNADVGPDQRPTVLHQTTIVPFDGLERGCKLAIDASPGCGGVVWPAGEQPDLLAGKNVLELGAGTGILALVLGLKEPRANIYATDQEPLMPLLRENVALNGLESTVQASVLDWGESVLPKSIPKPDYVLMADCVYFEPSFPLLVRTLILLTDDQESQPIIYLAYKKRRKADKRFFTLLHKSFSSETIEDDPLKSTYDRQGLHLMVLSRKKQAIQGQGRKELE